MTTRWPSLTNRTAVSAIKESVGNCVLRVFSLTIELVPKMMPHQRSFVRNALTVRTKFNDYGEMSAFHAYLGKPQLSPGSS